MRVASITESGGKMVVDEAASSVEIASVTSARRRVRKLACRLRPEARPSGERPYARLAARCFTRRRDPAQGAHRACNEAHTPQKALTSAHPTQRPNRPSTCQPPSQGGLDAAGVRRHRDPRRARCPMRSPRRLGGSRPEPSPTPTCAPYVVDALDGDDVAERPRSMEFDLRTLRRRCP